MAGSTKIVAMYLPQYHETEENNEFWGKGFTDWTTVKSAKPLFKGHNQPKIPLNQNYYDLSDPQSIRWQVELAVENGIDAFCFYHYWFSSDKNVLCKPTDILRDDESMNIEYCLAWDNASWKRTWSTLYGNAWAPLYDKKNQDGKEILIELNYGDEAEWEKHFAYLLTHFRQKRYIKIDNKPVFIILNYYQNEVLQRMHKYWNDLAIKEGFGGVYIIGRHRQEIKESIFDGEFLYQPLYSGWLTKSKIELGIRKLNQLVHKGEPKYYDYDTVWQDLIFHSENMKEGSIFFGAFVDYDDTPRRGVNGKVIKNPTPDKFYKYFSKIYDLSKQNKKKLLFLTAWNEWGEGAYLEPDSTDAYKYLEVIKRVKSEMEE